MNSDFFPQRHFLTLKVYLMIVATFIINISFFYFYIGDAPMTVHAPEAPRPFTPAHTRHVILDVMDLGL